MKVLLDANIYISYLLVRQRRRIIADVVHVCLEQDAIELLAPEELITKLRHAVERKAYLQKYVSPTNLADLLSTIREIAVTPAPLGELLIKTRDSRDDYLLAYGLIERVDYLVTGDDDLLSLGQVENLHIVTAGEFWRILESMGW